MKYSAVFVLVISVVLAAEGSEMKRSRRGYFRYREPRYRFFDDQERHYHRSSNFDGDSDLADFEYGDFRMGERLPSFSFNNLRPFDTLVPFEVSTISPVNNMPMIFPPTRSSPPTNSDLRMSDTIGSGPMTVSTEAPLIVEENKFNDAAITASTVAPPAMPLSTVMPKLTLGYGSDMFTNAVKPATGVSKFSAAHKHKIPKNTMISYKPAVDKVPISMPDVSDDAANRIKMTNAQQTAPNNVIYDSSSPVFTEIKQTLADVSLPSLSIISEPPKEIRYGQLTLSELLSPHPVPAAPKLTLDPNPREIPLQIVQGGHIPVVNFDQGYRQIGYAASPSGLNLNLGGYDGIDYSGIHGSPAVRPLTLRVANVGLSIPAIQAAPATSFQKTWAWP